MVLRQILARHLGEVALVQAGMIIGLAFYGIYRFGQETSVGAWRAVLYGSAALVVGGVIISFLVSRGQRVLERSHDAVSETEPYVS